MDVREKLAELLADAPYNIYGDRLGDWFFKSGLEITAGYLMARGVTLQEWISVKDRLPEEDSDVLAYLQIDQEGRIYPANYAKGVWFDCIFNTPATGTTTHWMPLPEPPKGE